MFRIQVKTILHQYQKIMWLRKMVPTGNQLKMLMSYTSSYLQAITGTYNRHRYSTLPLKLWLHLYSTAAYFRIIKVLGSGQFGTVNKGIWQSPAGDMDVAVKQLQPGASEKEKVKFLQEAAINGQFRHPNVVKLMGVVTGEGPVSKLKGISIANAMTQFLSIVHTYRQW